MGLLGWRRAYLFVHSDPQHHVVQEVAEDVRSHNAAVLAAPGKLSAKVVHLFTVGTT